jgi:hypothetical protein
MQVFADAIWPEIVLLADGREAPAEPMLRRAIWPRQRGWAPIGWEAPDADAHPFAELFGEAGEWPADAEPGPLRRAAGGAMADASTEALVKALRYSIPRRPRRWTGGHLAGQRLDIKRVIAAAAMGQPPTRVWQHKHDFRPMLAILLLVDHSGSMRGEKIRAAVSATKLLSRAFSDLRKELAWSVYGFQDVIYRLVDFGERATPEVLAKLDEALLEVEGARPGGNNQPGVNEDGPCLLSAAALLDTRPEPDRLLVVISDGSPSGGRSTKADLTVAVAQVSRMNIQLVGIGCGPGTQHVREFYPISEADVALADLAGVVGRLVAMSFRIK